MAVVDGAPTTAEIGSGNIDFNEVCGACDESGVTWYMVEQDVCSGSPLDSLKMSYSYIKEELCT